MCSSDLAKRDEEDLQAEIAELSSKPSKENNKKAGKLIAALEYKQKLANKDIEDELKALKKELKDYITKCDDIEMLYDIRNLID